MSSCCPGRRRCTSALTQSPRQAKLDALLKKIGAASTQVGGWTAFAERQSALDTFTAAKAKLADYSLYKVATAKLADEALVHAYANGIEAQKLLNLASKNTTAEAVGFEWASADVTAAGDALRLHAYSRDGMTANLRRTAGPCRRSRISRT